MNIKKFFSFFMIMLFFLTVPFTLLADDFGDDDLDNGSNSSSDDLGDDSSDSGDDFSEPTKKEDKSDDLNSLDDSSLDKKDSVKDDLGLTDEAPKKKKTTLKEDLGIDDSSLSESKKNVTSSGIKPVAIIKGGYYIFSQYKGAIDNKTHGERFGALMKVFWVQHIKVNLFLQKQQLMLELKMLYWILKY